MGPYIGCLLSTHSITCLFLSVLSSSSIIKSGEKMPVYPMYLLEISNRAFSYYKTAKNRVQKGCVSANLCLLISSTFLTVGKASAVMYDP